MEMAVGRLTRKVVLETGAAGGIGAAVVKVLLAEAALTLGNLKMARELILEA